MVPQETAIEETAIEEKKSKRKTAVGFDSISDTHSRVRKHKEEKPTSEENPVKASASKVKSFVKKLFSKGFWKSVLTSSIYFALAVLTLHDLFIIIAHSINPKFLEWSSPYFMDKLLDTILHTLSF